VAREYQITENTISKWRRQHRQYQDRAFAGRAMPIRMRRGFTNSRMVGRLTMRERLFKKALAETGKRELSSAPATPAVVYGRATPTSGRETDRRAEPYQARRGGRSLSLSLSLSTIWRQLRQPSTTRNDELELRSQIQTIALEMRTYGYRPITAELHRRGSKVNRKHVLRLLREDLWYRLTTDSLGIGAETQNRCTGVQSW